MSQPSARWVSFVRREISAKLFHHNMFNVMNVTVICFEGMRRYMEDCFTVAYQKSDNGKDLDYAFFGMFDG